MSQPGARVLSREQKLELLARRLAVGAPAGDQRPLTSAQARLWFLTQLTPGTPLYNIPARLRLTGPLHVEALERSLEAFIQRHEVLRTTYAADPSGRPQARVMPPAAFALRRVDLAALPEGAQDAALQRLGREEALRPFDLRQAPLARALLARLAEQEHVLLLTLHHIAMDGRSLLVLVRELEALYPAFVHGRPSPLPPPVRQYAQAAALQARRLQGAPLDELLAFWRRELAGAPFELALPHDHARPSTHMQRFQGGRVHAAVTPELATRLRALGDEQGATPFMVLLAAYQALLQRCTGQSDLLVGTPVLGRTLVETEDVPGLFANTLVLRGRPAPERSFRELLVHTRAAVLRALSHQELPFEKLVETLRPERTIGRNPLFEVMFALQSDAFPTLSMEGLQLRFLEPDPGTAAFDLNLTLRETQGRLTSVLEYSRELFLETTARRLLDDYHALLGAVSAQPDLPLGELPLAQPARAARDSAPAVTSGADPTPRPTTRAATALEEALAALWHGLLGRRPESPDDDFFALGGHSLLAMRLAVRVREAFGVELALETVFERSTLGAQAQAIVAARGARPTGAPPSPIARIERGGPLELSAAQARLWFLERLAPDEPVYAMPLLLRLRGALDRAALERALDELVRRHEVLRTRLALIDGRPMQWIEPPCAWPLETVAFDGLDEQAFEAAVERRAQDELRRPLDLGRVPCARALLMRRDQGEHALLVLLHHVSADGWALGVLFEELSQLYAAFEAGQPSPLPEVDVQYADCAAWQARRLEQGDLQGDLTYWREQLDGAPTSLPLPCLRGLTHERAAGAAGGHVLLRLPGVVAERVRALGRAHAATPFMVLLAAFEALLYRTSGQSDFTVGTPVAGRGRPELERVVGLFTNTLVLRARLAPGLRFRALLETVRHDVLSAFAHQELPFDRLVEAVHPQRSASENPLFRVMFALQNLPPPPRLLGALRLELREVHTATAKFDLSLTLVERPEGDLLGAFEYRSAVVSAEDARHMAAAYVTLLEAALAQPETQVMDLPLLDGEGHARALAGAQGATRPLPQEDLVALLVTRARSAPQACAVASGHTCLLRYAELHARAARLATRLRALGVGPEVRVALCAERSADMLAALLGVSLAGGAFALLDPHQPALRLERACAQVRPRLVLIDRLGRERLNPEGLGLDALDLHSDETWSASPLAAPVTSSQAALAYVVCTSGTTGAPRAVGVPQRALLNHVCEAQRRFALQPTDRVLHFASPAFDVALEEVLPTWLAGAAVVLRPEEPPAPGDAFTRLLDHAQVSVVNLPASYWQEWTAALGVPGALPLPACLRLAVVGSEPVSREAARQWARLTQVPLHNAYGTSETTITNTLHAPQADDEATPVPIGRPWANVRALVLDARLEPLPPGVPGELYLGGSCLARGYLERPDLTAARFVPDPFGAPGERLYRSGDRVRRLHDDALQFLGRVDHQVKVRGLRLEPDEVAAALAEHPHVRAALVLARGAHEHLQLVAYHVAPPDTPAASPEDLRAFLRERLPAAFLPHVFVALPAFPLTSTGKIDRAALPPPDDAADTHVFVAPQTPDELRLAELWAALLRVPRVGSSDDFFALGGHSLLAMRLVAGVREAFGVELALETVFERSTLGAQAQAIVAARGARPAGAPPSPIARIERGGPLELSAAQARLWFLERLAPDEPVYAMPLLLRLRGALDRAALERALDELVRRHEVLRTRLALVDGRPMQWIEPPCAWPLETVAFDGLDEQAFEAAVERRAQDELRRPLDLGRVPCARALLMRREQGEHALLVLLHHVSADGWALGVLFEELSQLYAAFEAGQASPLPEVDVQYADCAAWQARRLEQGDLQGDLTYWREQLDGAPTSLPLPCVRGLTHERAAGAAGGHVLLRLPGVVAERVRALGRAHAATPFMVLLAAFEALLYRTSGQSDFTVGTPVAGRGRPELERVVGLFTNTLVLRARLAPGLRFRALLETVRHDVLSAFAHQELPFDRLVEAIHPQRSASENPLFRVMFALQNLPPPPRLLGALQLELREVHTATAKFDLSLTLVERPEGDLLGAFEYRSAVVSAEDARHMAAAYVTLLEAALAQPETQIADLPLLDGEGHARALAGAQGATRPLPQEDLVALLVTRARSAPQACAVASGHACLLRYAELHARAARLATRLRALGVGPEVRVALCAERSADMLAALLGVSLAGGAFALLDPHQPALRLERACAQVRPRLVLIDRLGRERLNPEGLGLDALDLHSDETWSASPLAAPVTSSQAALAYVVCTSGTTGAPRAVGVPQRALLNHVCEAQRRFALQPTDRVLHFASPAFDVALEEVLPTWLAGAAVVLRPEEPPAPGDAFTRLLDHAQVSVVNLPASYWQEWTAALGVPGALPLPACLRLAVVGSEPVSREAARQWARLTQVPLHNAYGTSETTITNTLHAPQADDEATPVPIGRPWANVRALVLDARLEPLPPGVPGELYLGGNCLARGYLERPDLTAARFVPDPFGAPGERLYRSGDRVRRLHDDALQFLGRVDHQVKVRGLRLEPDEVAAALAEHPHVRAALVLARDAHEHLQLVAYHVAPPDTPAASPEDLRAFLRERLPAAFLPHVFVALPAFPLTSTGKIDRAALPPPDDAADTHVFVAPQTPDELRLAELWAALLRVPRVGGSDDFFALGGHSLLAMRLVAGLEEVFGVHVALRALFEQPTLRAQARLVAQLRAAGATSDARQALRAEPAERYEPFPLTELQEAYWVGRTAAFELGNVGAHGYQELDCEELDVARLEAAWRRLIERHDMLRAVVRPDGRQQVLAHVPPFRVEVEDLRKLAPAAAEARLLERRAEWSHQVLPADEWPLFRVRASLLPGRTRLHVSSDALIADDLSWQTLERELLASYREPERALPPLTLTFRDYVLAEERLRSGPAHGRALEYWRERGAHMPAPPELPLARPLSSVTRPTFRRLRRALAPETRLALEAQAARRGCTLSALLLAAFGEALAAFTRRPHFCLALTRFHRLPLHAEVEHVVGDFTRVALLELDQREVLPFQERARRVQARLWDDLEHGSAGGVALLRELSRRHGVPPVVPVVFTSTLGQDDLESGAALAGLGRPVYAISQTPQVMLDHQVFVYEGALVTNWDAVAEVFPDGLLDALAEGYFGLLARLAHEQAAWETPAGGFVPARQLAVRAQVNASARAFPEATLHGLFLAQVGARRQAPALIAPARTLTYGELERRSAACARLLRRLGLRPGERVAVVMDKGWEQAVAALGVLRAGGAYVPLDPALPQPRLDGILRQAEARFAFTTPRWQAALAWPAGTRALPVDEAAPEADDEPLAPEPAHPDALAYVIYTSGSTGTPKGVMISHRGAVNTVLDVNERLGVGPDDRVLSLSSFGFDLSVYDLFGLLAAGGAMVLPEAGAEQDPAHWAARLSEARVSLWNSVPALMELLVEHGQGRAEWAQTALRHVLLSGDRIALTLPERVRALFPRARVSSLGGATEASIWSIYFPCHERDPEWSAWPYGQPLANQSWHVLDERLAPRPDWVPGELHIAGVGLALGYLGDEQQTRARFVQAHDGQRLYRTGDLGYARPDGTLCILGRLDHQVKVRGYRIELGEIEAALQQHPGVREAAAAPCDAPDGERRLVAGVVAHGVAPTASELREFLRQRLPAYMLPSTLAVLERLPLGANGKLDRRALAGLVPGPERTASPAGPADQDAARVATLVARVLRREQVAPDANLLELGATSVDLIRLLNLLEAELGFRPRVAALYAEPTALALAALWRRARPNDQPPAAATAQFEPAVVVIKDEAERAAFRQARHGLRHEDAPAGRPRVSLPDVPRPGLERRTQREFSTRPVPLEALARLLASARQWDDGGQPRYLYGSAGSLYPVQLHLHVKPGRVAGLGAGVYYYHPLEHHLTALAPGAELNGELHEHFWNRPIFERAAFSLFCILRRGAIEPLYGSDALRFATLEAGALCQLLEERAAGLGLGLCQIGALDFERVRGLFHLRADDALLHSLVGGLLPGTTGFEEGEL